MTTLTNPRAARVRAVGSLGRRSVRQRQQRFVAEGPQAVREAVRFAPEQVREFYLDSDAAQRHAEIVQAALDAGIPVTEVTTEVLRAMSDTDHPQGLLAVCTPLDVDLDVAIGADPRLIVILTNVRDPGNAGTVIRCADAAGADAVLVSADSVDIYNPKVVRSTAGSLWHLPISRGAQIEQILDRCREAGLALYAADGVGETLLPEADLVRPHSWVMGNEAWGLDEQVRQACDDVVRVPIHGHAESLNLAMAATVCLYASAGAQRSL